MSPNDLGLNPYVELRTGTYYNKVGARTPEDLKEREAEFTNVRLRQLKTSPVDGNFDLAHLKEINRRLLQDVYEWAGSIRKNFDAANRNTSALLLTHSLHRHRSNPRAAVYSTSSQPTITSKVFHARSSSRSSLDYTVR